MYVFSQLTCALHRSPMSITVMNRFAFEYDAISTIYRGRFMFSAFDSCQRFSPKHIRQYLNLSALATVPASGAAAV